MNELDNAGYVYYYGSLLSHNVRRQSWFVSWAQLHLAWLGQIWSFAWLSRDCVALLDFMWLSLAWRGRVCFAWLDLVALDLHLQKHESGGSADSS